MSKDTFYFSHDTNAFLDPKIRVLISEYGIMSYAVFWVIVEMLSAQKDYKINITGFVKSLHPLLQGKHFDYDPNDGIGGYTDDEGNNVNVELVGCHRIELAYATALFNTMIDVGLFKTDGKYFWSESLIERMNLRNEKSQKQRDKALKRWHPKAKVDNNNATVMPQQKDGNATPYAKQCLKGKERKGKENKGNNISGNTDIEDKQSMNMPLKSVSVDKNNGYKELIDIYQKESGDFEENSVKRLIKCEEVYSRQWVIDAIKDSVMQNQIHIHYIEGILKNYKKEGHLNE